MALSTLGLDRQILYQGCATNEFLVGSKQQDVQLATMENVREPNGRMRNTPTVVLESVVTASETVSPKLLSDVRFWLEQSGSAIQVVFAMKIGRRAPEIVFEKWEPDNGQAKRRSTTVVRKIASGHLEISGDPCTLGLKQLFLWQPRTTSETELHLEREFLTEVAMDTWISQAFMSPYECDDAKVANETQRKTSQDSGVSVVI